MQHVRQRGARDCSEQPEGSSASAPWANFPPELVASIARARIALELEPPQPPPTNNVVDLSDFHAAPRFDGSRAGYIFRVGSGGLGYYPDECPTRAPLELSGTVARSAVLSHLDNLQDTWTQQPNAAAALVRMLTVCKSWNVALNASSQSLWKQAALGQYSRLGPILAAFKQPAGRLCFRTLYRNQLQAQDEPLTIAPKATTSMSDYVWTYEIWGSSQPYDGPTSGPPTKVNVSGCRCDDCMSAFNRVDTRVLKATWSGAFEDGEKEFASTVLWEVPDPPKDDEARDEWLEEALDDLARAEEVSAKTFVTRRPGETILVATATEVIGTMVGVGLAEEGAASQTASLLFGLEAVPDISGSPDFDLVIQARVEASAKGVKVASTLFKQMGDGDEIEPVESNDVLLWLEHQVPWESALRLDYA
jgi:hypothetical protein